MTAPATIQIAPPEGFKYEEGKPIELPISSIPFKNFVPSDIAEKDFMKKIDGFESLFKSFTGAQELLGKKPAYSVPGADANDEEWGKFLSAIRAPKMEDYQFEENPNVPTELKATPEYQNEVRKMFHEAGLNPRQAKVLAKKWDEFQLKQYEAETAKRGEQNKQFAELMSKTFGDKAEEKLSRGKAILESMIPKEMQGALGKAPNEVLQVLAVFANAVADKYMKEDEIPKGGSSGKSVENLRKEAQEKMKEMLALDAMDPKKKTLKEEVDALYEQLGKMTG